MLFGFVQDRAKPNSLRLPLSFLVVQLMAVLGMVIMIILLVVLKMVKYFN